MPPEPTADQRAALTNGHAICEEIERRMRPMGVITTAHYDAGSALIDAALDAAFARGRRAGLEEGAGVAEKMFPKIDGPGWLARDQERAVIAAVAAALRKLAAGGAT